MLDPRSRYYALETAQFTLLDGRTVAYKRRRFLPQGKDLPVLREITVTQGDRLDLITARTLGNPELFWQVCDANNAMNPVALTAEPGRSLYIPLPPI